MQSCDSKGKYKFTSINLNQFMTSSETIFTAIIAVILGIAFPILTQSIGDIDKKYGSTRLTRRFKNEFKYKFFISILIVTLILLAYYIFAPPRIIDFDSLNQAIEQSAAFIVVVSTILLVIALFALIFLILDYYDPDILHSLASNEIIDPSDGKGSERKFKEWIDILLFLFKNDKQDMIRKGYEVLYEYVSKFREDKQFQDIEYPDYFYDSIIAINESLCTLKQKPISINNGNDILKLLYDSYQKTIISDKTQRVLWICLNQQLFYDKDEWILEYWINAHQHFSFYLPNIYEGYRIDESDSKIATKEDVEKRNKEREKYLEFHYALGGLLLYKEKYKLLAEILKYSNQTPEKYYLIPSSFNSIITTYMKLQEFSSDSFYKYEQNYPFLSIKGVNSNDIIKSWIEQYLAILIIRLYYISPNYNYGSTFTEPQIPKTVGDKKKWIDELTYLSRWVKKYTSKIPILEIMISGFDISTPKDNKPEELVLALLNKAKEEYNEQKEEQELDKDKENKFKSAIVDITNEKISIYNKINNTSTFKFENPKEYYIGVTIRQLTAKGRFVNDQEMSYIGFETSMASLILENFYSKIANVFVQQPHDSYLIRTEDILIAINNLGLTPDKHVIISFNVDLDLYLNKNNIQYDKNFHKIETNGNDVYKYNEIEIINLGGSRIVDNRIFVLRKEDLPFMEYQTPLENEITEYGLEKLKDSNFNLYLKIINLQENNDIKEKIEQENFIENLNESALVCIDLNAILKWKSKIKRMVSINIFHQYDNSGSSFDVTKIEPFES